MMVHAKVIFYPTLNYAQFFTTLDKPIFPSLETHLYADDKIKQTTLYYMLGIPHPRTRIYYHLHHADISKDFSFPFVAKLPRASARGRGIFKIHHPDELAAYLRMTNIAYVQEYLPHERDLRVILINYSPVLAYWRRRPPGNFKTNLSQGGTISFEAVPGEALDMAREFAQKCKFNDVGLDMIHHHGTWYLIEANMLYGRKGLKIKDMRLKAVLREKILSGELIP
jgi:ribosomal protein S6--L-glutamate ligase